MMLGSMKKPIKQDKCNALGTRIDLYKGLSERQSLVLWKRRSNLSNKMFYGLMLR